MISNARERFFHTLIKLNAQMPEILKRWLGLLQMVSDPDTEHASEDASPHGGGIRDRTSVGGRNESFLTRVWKPPLNGSILKP